MAKYKITSIPQFAPGGETNWPPDWMKNLMRNQRKVKLKSPKSNKGLKRKKLNEPEIPQQTSGWDSPVEQEIPQQDWSTMWPAQRDQYEKLYSTLPEYTTDPNQVDKPVSERTGLELVSTQPEFGNQGYGYKRDRFTGELKLVPAGTETYERDMFGNLITQVKQNPDAPVDYQGNKLNCPKGSRPYKGVCVTDEEYAQIQAKEEANISYWDQEERKRIAEEQEKARLKAEQDYINEYNTYYDVATKKGNKFKKGVLEPFRTYSKDIWEGQNFKNWYDDPSTGAKQLYYVEKKDLGDGNYEMKLYPRDAIKGMMSKWGVQPFQLEKFHGLDSKQVQKEFGDHLKMVHDIYLAQGQDFIDQYTKQGFSAEEAKKKLVENKNYGIPQGIEKNFKQVADFYDIKNNANKYFLDDFGVMYTADRSGNVYQYTNDAQNEDFKVLDYNSTDPNENAFAKVNDKNYSKQGTFSWQPVDKSKVQWGSQGGLTVNGRKTGFYDYVIPGRDKSKDENSVLTKYKNYVTDVSKDIANENKFYTEQAKYEGYNNHLYDQVYGSSWSGNIDEISFVDQMNAGGLNNDYVTAYNDAVKKMNAITKGKDVSSNPEYYRQQKAKILEEFNNKVSKFSFAKVNDKKINFGSLGGYEAPFEGRDISAYKDKNKLKSQIGQTINQEAANALRYAYFNNILPTEKNIINDQYRGEKEGWNDKYGNYYGFAASPEGKRFLETYKNQPSFGTALLEEADIIKRTNIAQDKYNKQVELARQRMENMQDNMPWYGLALDQGQALFNQPIDTVSDWLSGELQAPLVGVIGDQPTQQDLQNLVNTFGVGADKVYYDNLKGIIDNPLSQGLNLFNPLYFASETGRGLGRKILGDPDAHWGDIGLNAFFAFSGAGPVKALSGAKLLSPVAKYVPAALKTGKYLPRIGNAVTNIARPSNFLTAYFANDAFVPHTNAATGETEQGFAVDAAQKVWEGLTNEGGVDWDKISRNTLNLGMGAMIGSHALGTANAFGGNLIGKPTLINPSRVTQPVTQPIINFKNTIVNPPKLMFDPATGKYIYKQKGGPVLPKAAKGRPVKEKKAVEIKVPKPENIRENVKQNITKQLADISFTNYLNSTAPETMSLIADLKSQGIIAPTLPEGKLVTYPNLLNLATKRGIQDALTLARFTEPSLVEGVSSSGTKTPLSALDLKAYIDYNLLGDPAGMAMYSASHVPGMRYGRRDGLSYLPYETEYVGGRKQGTSESLDALYTFPSFSSQPAHIRQGIMSPTYGSYATILRYPFDYSGSAMDMFNRFRNFENQTAAQSKIMQMTGGKEGAVPGLIGGFKFSRPLEGFENSGIDPVFHQSWNGPPEAPVIGHPGQKVLEPLFTQTKPILKEIKAENIDLQKLYNEGKYEELINKLNDKIKSGDFGSPESNIEQINMKDANSEINAKIDVSKYDRYEGAPIPYQSKYIDPKTGLISLEGDLKDIANDAKQSYFNFMYFGPELDASRSSSNFVRTYYSPLRFKFKKGGELPEARFGKPIKLREPLSKPEPRPIEFENMVAKTRWWPDLSETNISRDKIQNSYNRLSERNPEFITSYWNSWNSLPQEGWHKKIRPTLDQSTLDLIKSMPPDSFSPIKVGDDYAAKGHEWYEVHPEDYYPLVNWKELGLNDANKSLNDFISKLPNYGSETFKGIGDFDFKPWSDGWQVRNDMMNAFDGPQYHATGKDFFSRLEFNDMLMKQLEYDMARMKFDEMHPEDPANMLLDALRGESNRRDEDFSNLFPNVSMPNWRSKFTTPEQESFLRERVMEYNPTVRQMGKLNPASLKTLNVGLDTLPKTYKDLVNQSKADTWLKTAPAKDVVSEMRGGLGVKLTDIQNATPEQLEAWRQQIVKKMYNQALQRWNNDINTPFKGSDAWREISNQAGYKNKNGGISMKLTKAEIDKYVKGGYIVEEE